MRDSYFLMGPSGRSVGFEKPLSLTQIVGMKADASVQINNLKEDDLSVSESAQCDDPKQTIETAHVNHESEKQVVDYVARHSVKESTSELNYISQKDQGDEIKQFANAAVNKAKVSNAAKKRLKASTRVIYKSHRSSRPSYKDQEDEIEELVTAAVNTRKVSNASKKKLKPFNKSLRSSHPSYPNHTFGPSAEPMKALLDLAFIDCEGSVVYKNTSLLSETHARGTEVLAAKIEPRKRNLLDEREKSDVEIDKGCEVSEQDCDNNVESVERYKVNKYDIALRDLFFLDWCEGYALIPKTHAEGTQLLSSVTEPLDEKRDADVEIEEGCEVDKSCKPARDLALHDSETTKYEDDSLVALPHAKGTELVAFEIEPLNETRDLTTDIDEACKLNEQGHHERDLVSQDSVSNGHEGDALAAEMHAKRTLTCESRKGHLFDDERGRSVDCDNAYEVNKLVPAFPDLLLTIETATKLLAALIESRRRQSNDEKRDPGIDVDAKYEEEGKCGTAFSDDCESAISFSFDNAVVTAGLPIAPTLDEDRMIISTLDEDAKIIVQAGLFSFSDVIMDDELRYKIDYKLTETFNNDKQLIRASKEFLPFYHVLKAMISEHEDQEGSVTSPCVVIACQLGAPLELMQDLQEWVSKCFSPK